MCMVCMVYIYEARISRQHSSAYNVGKIMGHFKHDLAGDLNGNGRYRYFVTLLKMFSFAILNTSNLIKDR